METRSMSLVTDAIGENQMFDPRYTCDLDNSSPELRWDHVPSNASGYVLLAEESNTQREIFTHWIVYNIPANVHHLPAGIPPQESLPNGIRQGINSLGKLGYAGPCPPLGDPPHRYCFRLYALGATPDLPPRLHRLDLLARIEPWIIAQAQVEGRYQRAIQKAG